MNIVILFTIIMLLILGPFFGIMKLREKFKRQQMEERLNTISKQLVIKTGLDAQHAHKKKYQSKLTPGKIFLIAFLPLPPLLVLLLSSSTTSALMSIAIYFSFIFFVYFIFVRMRHKRYMKAFIAELPNAIDLIIRSLRAGRTITDSIKTVGTETKGLVAEQFKQIIGQVELGRDFIQVLNDITRRVNVPEFSFFGIVLSVQQETGGNIIKTLSSLANMLRQRQLMRMKVKALSAEGIISAIFMGSLPIFVGTVILLIRPEYMALMFSTTTGNKMLIYGAVSEFLGCFFIWRMVQIDV